MAFNALLPAYRVDSNPFAQSFNALGSGIDQIGKTLKDNAQRDINRGVTNALASGDYKGAMAATDDPALALNIGNAQIHKQQADFQMKRAKIEQLGNLATVADSLPVNDPRRGQLLSRIMAEHPNAGSLDPMYSDPVMGPRLLRAEAGKARDELEEQAKRASISLSQAQASKARAEAGAAGQKDALQGFIVDTLKGINAQPSAPQGGVQKQSFDGASPNALYQNAGGSQPQSDPNLIRVADGQPQAAEPLVDTPLGALPAAKAKALGFAFALAGKGDAGKMLTEAADPGKLSKTAEGENDKTEVGLSNQMGRLREIASSYDPNYLKGTTQLGMWGKQLMSKWATLKPEDQAQLYKYATFRKDAASNLNKVLKEVSGTAVTENEMQRMLHELPNAGTGVMDGDDPVTFKAKLDRSVEAGAMAIARARYLRTQGFKGKPWEAGIEIEQMRGIINDRARQIEGALRKQNPSIDKSSLDRAVDMQVKKEFGI